MENTIVLVLCGAYAYLCIDIVVKMFLRTINYEDYTVWQRHLYTVWGGTMALTLVSCIWKVVVVYYQISPDTIIYQNMRLIALLNVQLVGMMLWTLTSHKILQMKQIRRQFLPFVLITIGVCILNAYIPGNKAAVILYVGEIIYCVIMFRKYFRYIRLFNQSLYNYYSDTYRRNLQWVTRLVWMFSTIFIVYIIFNHMMPGYDWIYMPIIIAYWSYIHYHILTMRETKVMEEGQEDEDDDEVEYSEVITEEHKPGKVTPREKSKLRLEEILEDTCLNKRLYLNPDLTVNDLATELETNRTYVSQYFSDHHTTFLKYINDLRAEYAMYQIKNTSNPIQDIMADSGFRHIETFNRAFMSRYNCNPTDVERKS